jgi:hypothetical protein
MTLLKHFAGEHLTSWCYERIAREFEDSTWRMYLKVCTSCTSGVMGWIGLIVFLTSSLGNHMTNSNSQTRVN